MAQSIDLRIQNIYMHYFSCSLHSESDVFLFQIISAVVCLCGGSQINHYNYILTVRMTTQYKLTRVRSRVSITSQWRKLTNFLLSNLRTPQ
jgi:hypothetical protein